MRERTVQAGCVASWTAEDVQLMVCSTSLCRLKPISENLGLGIQPRESPEEMVQSWWCYLQTLEGRGLGQGYFLVSRELDPSVARDGEAR